MKDLDNCLKLDSLKMYNGYIWESTKPCVCSKKELFKKAWQIIRVLPQLSSLGSNLPHLRAIKWYTVWLHTSRGIKKGTQKYDRSKLKGLNLLNKSWTFKTMTWYIFDTPWGNVLAIPDFMVHEFAIHGVFRRQKY